MKLYIICLLFLLPFTAHSQDSTANNAPLPVHKVFERHSVMVTLSVGFIDWYRHNYALTQGFGSGSASGFDPFNFKAEYAVGKHISIAASFMYDAFNYNYSQLFQNNGSVYPRYISDNERVFGGGVVAYYHFNKLIRVNNLDVFAGVGGMLYHARHNNYPQGDSTATDVQHIAAPVLKAGARYYITKNASFFADAGYDKSSIFSLGFTCRFFRKE